MVSLSEKRQAAKYILKEYEVSERKTCRILTLDRKILRYKSKRQEVDGRLKKRIFELSRQKPRYGYRFITAILKREGFRVGSERVRIIRKMEGLKVLRKQRKKRHSGDTKNRLLKAEHTNHVWSYDFIFDQTGYGQTIKSLVIMDEYTKECLSIVSARRIGYRRLQQELQRLFFERGFPQYVRSDNGPEFIAKNLKKFFADSNIVTLYIEPGSPWENPHIESFNDKFRDECLNANWFVSIADAQRVTAAFRQDYNNFRPHSALNYLTPSEFAAQQAQSVKVA